MILLKGNVGKSVIVERLSSYTDTLIFSYGAEEIYNIKGLNYVLSKETSIQRFCLILEEYLKKGFINIVIIYTNLNEEEIDPIKEVIEKLEKENAFRFGIITCK